VEREKKSSKRNEEIQIKKKVPQTFAFNNSYTLYKDKTCKKWLEKKRMSVLVGIRWYQNNLEKFRPLQEQFSDHFLSISSHLLGLISLPTFLGSHEKLPCKLLTLGSIFLSFLTLIVGHAVETLCYTSRKVAGSNPDEVIGCFT
jgi:hypothetical protein